MYQQEKRDILLPFYDYLNYTVYRLELFSFNIPHPIILILLMFLIISV